MSIVSHRAALLSALALALLLVVPMTASAGEVREFKANNVKWTLPAGWSFEDLTDAQKSGGYFASVEHTDMSGSV